MAHAVPSQICKLMVKRFPDMEKEPAQKGQHGLRQATDIRAVLDLVERIPDGLVRFSADEDALFWANTFSLRSSWEDGNVAYNQKSDLRAYPLNEALHIRMIRSERLRQHVGPVPTDPGSCETGVCVESGRVGRDSTMRLMSV